MQSPPFVKSFKRRSPIFESHLQSFYPLRRREVKHQNCLSPLQSSNSSFFFSRYLGNAQRGCKTLRWKLRCIRTCQDERFANNYSAHFEITPTKPSTHVECSSITDAPINATRYNFQCAIVEEGTCMSDNFPTAKTLGTLTLAPYLVMGSCSFHRY